MKRSRFVNALLLVLALSPVGALALILAGPRWRPAPEGVRGTFNGTPFSLQIRTSLEDPPKAVSRAEASFLRRGAKMREDFHPWEALAAHPLVRSRLAEVIPGKLAEFPDGSSAAAFAMPRPGDEGPGSVLALFETKGPLRAGLERGPGRPVLDIRWGPLVIQKFDGLTEQEIIGALKLEGWMAQPGSGLDWTAFQKEGWNAVLAEGEDSSRVFLAYSGGRTS